MRYRSELQKRVKKRIELALLKEREEKERKKEVQLEAIEKEKEL